MQHTFVRNQTQQTLVQYTTNTNKKHHSTVIGKITFNTHRHR